MRHCNKCGNDLPDSSFGKNGNGSRSICKKCQSERIKQGQYETRDYIQSLKVKCSKCGYNRCKEALEFHHLNPTEKDNALAQYSRRVFSPMVKKLIDNEVAKCIILCANCHREEHFL